jgi:lipopolysaccharide export system protein LptA
MIKKGYFFNTVISLLSLIVICLLAASKESSAQSRKRVEILHTDLLNYNARIVADAQRLLGNVNITVDGAMMWCDSLYSYSNNTVDAFGNVHIVRGDTLDMYADFINYNGNNKLAKARRNVKLIDKQVILTTDSLDYTMANDLASYNNNGTIKDSTNVLTSLIGQYYVNDKKAFFKTRVDVVTKDYKIKSDTLIYFTDSKKVMIEGPTYIFNETDTLYSERGWYDSMKGLAQLTKKPRIWNIKQQVKADSIFYDKEKGEGLARGNAHIQDIENSIIVRGNRVQYNDLTKIASATDSAVLIQYSKTDSLFLHADLLRTMPDTSKIRIPVKRTVPKPATKTAKPDSLALKNLKTDSLAVKSVIPDSLSVNPYLSGIQGKKVLFRDSLAVLSMPRDSLASDSLKTKTPKDARLVLAYFKVRFYRDDVQGKCDSLAYFSKDSTIQMYTDPVIWSDKNQISANYIEIINKSKNAAEIRMKEDAFIIAMEDDSLRFNQIKGKNMVGYVRQNELVKIDVDGNGQSNYYARDKNGIIGLNKAESSNITIYMNKGKVKRIAFIKMPDGELKPMAELEEGDKLLPGFKWQAELRPVNKEDIFRDPVKNPSPLPQPAPVTEPVK